MSLPFREHCVLAAGLPSDYVRTHHFIVFVIDDVAVPDVPGTHGGVEGIEVDAR